jgi:serine/threonine-protein kinase TTK/MPS1
MSTSPSTSPPRTPDERLASHSKASSTPSSDDSSVIDDLSFDYVLDGEGNFIRLSKGSSSKSNYSSPPTPQEAPLQPDLPPTLKPPASPSDLPISRISLSRSESAFPILTGGSAALQNDKPARSFQRVASGPALSATGSYLAPTTSLSKPRTIPRRVTMEEHGDRPEANGASRLRQTLDSTAYALQEEKENISEPDENPYAPSIANKRRHSPPLATRSVPSSRAPRTAYSGSAASRPLAEVPVPQRGSHTRQIMPGPNRAGRIMKSSSKYGATASAVPFDRISEHEGSESEYPPGDSDYHAIGIALGGDDTDPEDEPVRSVEPASVPLPSSIPATSQVGSARLRTHLSVNVNFGRSNSLGQSGGTRPRRSASLSDALSTFHLIHVALFLQSIL